MSDHDPTTSAELAERMFAPDAHWPDPVTLHEEGEWLAEVPEPDPTEPVPAPDGTPLLPGNGLDDTPAEPSLDDLAARMFR